MIVDVKVPVFSESIHEGTLLEWRKKIGERVSRDDVLVEIETDKVVLEVPSPEAGVLREVLKQSGETVHSEDLIAQVDTTDSRAATAPEKPSEPIDEVAPSEAESKPAPTSPTPSKQAEEPLSPAVRKLISEHDLEPKAIAGSGRGGRLTKEDVLTHLETLKSATPHRVVTEPVPQERAGRDQPVAAPAAGERLERREPMSEFGHASRNGWWKLSAQQPF